MTRTWIGIDIAKLKFDVAIIFEDKRKFHKVFTNTQQGFLEFIKWLENFSPDPPHFCLEATGTYGYELAYFLNTKKYKVSIVNPARIKAYAMGEGVRNKTDKVDSYVIARFCKTQDPMKWAPPSANLYELQGLYRCLQNLQEDLVRVNNRLESCVMKSKTIKKIWGDSIKNLKAKIKEVEEQIQSSIDEDQDLGKQVELLESIPAIVAKQHNPILKGFGERLKSKGKNGMLIVCAIMRKLLHIIYGVLKNQQPFSTPK